LDKVFGAKIHFYSLMVLKGIGANSEKEINLLDNKSPIIILRIFPYRKDLYD